MNKKMEAVLDLADKLSAEDKASVAGLLLNTAGVTESNVQKFLEPIVGDSRDDLFMYIQEAPLGGE